LEKIDNRKVPVLEKYDENSGQCLHDYCKKFEKYCGGNFKGGKDAWTGELERHLEGKTLQAFSSLKHEGNSYDVVKRKLLQWYNDMKETRKKRNKLSFTNAQYDSSESMFIFSNRLEKLFKLAYPFRRVEDSRTLRERYVAAVPKPFRRILTSQILSY
jgi:hypothetical protein